MFIHTVENVYASKNMAHRPFVDDVAKSENVLKLSLTKFASTIAFNDALVHQASFHDVDHFGTS